ncbi:ankyrin repeat-containing domain protein, partial [Blastocladiella britannica]
MAAAAAKASNSIRATSTTTVFDAAYDGNLPAVRAFLDTTPEQQPTPVSLSRDDDLRTPLHWACSGSAVEVIEWLLKHGADANAADDSQWTPLIIAASVGSVPAIELLLAHGANVNASTETGATALHYAVSKNYPAAVRVLLDAGALPNVANRHGQLPMYIHFFFNSFLLRIHCTLTTIHSVTEPLLWATLVWSPRYTSPNPRSTPAI